jgi:hypothetical protein
MWENRGRLHIIDCPSKIRGACAGRSSKEEDEPSRMMQYIDRRKVDRLHFSSPRQSIGNTKKKESNRLTL